MQGKSKKLLSHSIIIFYNLQSSDNLKSRFRPLKKENYFHLLSQSDYNIKKNFYLCALKFNSCLTFSSTPFHALSTS